jgi:hypothetical protein
MSLINSNVLNDQSILNPRSGGFIPPLQSHKSSATRKFSYDDRKNLKKIAKLK